MKKFLPLFFLYFLISCFPVAAGPLPLVNPGFEEGLSGWIALEKDAPMSAVDPEAAHSGTAGLRVDDKSRDAGSSLVSQMLPAAPGNTYRLSFYARTAAGNKGAVYLRFLDASRKIINADKLPMATVNKSGDWEQYTLEAVAPEGTVGLAIWIHTWSGATGVTDFDDFVLEVTEGSAQAAPPAIAPKPVAAKSPAAQPRASRDKPALIVLKLDDLKTGQSGNASPNWARVLEILKAKGVKASFGLICDSLEKAKPGFLEWVKEVNQSGQVEIWFHGLNHDVHVENGVECAEFVGRPYDEQKRRFEEGIRLAKDKVGVVLQTFGPPGGGKAGSLDEATVRVMADVPEMKVWLYPQPLDDAGSKLAAGGKVTILDRVWAANIEQPLFVPNAEKLKEGYMKNPQRRYFVLQGHPAKWKDEGFAEFEKIVDFLKEQGAVFVTPTECAALLATEAAANH